MQGHMVLVVFGDVVQCQHVAPPTKVCLYICGNYALELLHNHVGPVAFLCRHRPCGKWKSLMPSYPPRPVTARVLPGGRPCHWPGGLCARRAPGRRNRVLPCAAPCRTEGLPAGIWRSVCLPLRRCLQISGSRSTRLWTPAIRETAG
ncbi:hypothetical protein SDC9_185705 [bioreactor metagenome]|uniref:Uncharacterized protein n=1 Tax=bioreactor metagenome TaxID=1076179 RepID=A0A645HGM8_9ZZZZ